MSVEIGMFQEMNNYITHSIRRTGHARFRRGPVDQSTTTIPCTSTSSYSHDQPQQRDFIFKVNFEECKSADSSMSSGISTIAGEKATVSNGKLGILITGVARNYSSAKPPLAPLFHRKKLREIKQCISTDSPIFSESNPTTKCYSSAKPPLPSSHRKRGREIQLVSGDWFSSQGCHCCKRRKKIEITRRIRISKGSLWSIPSDEYSWKKYDHKLITGSSSRGGYYKCSCVKGCSARKHVILDKSNPMFLIVTYKGQHNHQLPETEISTKLNDIKVKSR